MSDPIIEDWLKSVGFKWHQFDRQPNKQWLLWLGACQDCPDRRMFSGTEDIGIELAPVDRYRDDSSWFCWLRSDTAHRYSRFIHVRHLKTQYQVVALVEAITGFPWNPENHLYGSVRCQVCADRCREESERLDRRITAQSGVWYEHERDETRGRPVGEHIDAAIKGGLAK